MARENNLEACRVEKLTTILAIGTTNPPNCFYQADYLDFYFRVTKSERSTIKKRCMYLTEAMLKENPNLTIYKAPSFDIRQEILVTEVPKLGMEAALKAIKEWGQPISKITHLIFCTSSGIDMPSADHKLAKLIGLKPSVQRFMIYNQGCFGGASALRLAKDLAENNATALVVGSNPIASINERPLFQIVSASQTFIPESDDMLIGKVREMGIEYYMSRDLPKYIANNIVQCMAEAFTPFGITEWENLFYVVHPGGAAILKGVEEKLGLNKEKLKASWHVLSEYGNMRSPTVFLTR
ncbi:hypothetical protein GOBAR_DD22508 [Gossypium barbadense]|nr:hypothetical protein GOBAR_DD22508 [Gossypium barbadense]